MTGNEFLKLSPAAQAEYLTQQSDYWLPIETAPDYYNDVLLWNGRVFLGWVAEDGKWFDTVWDRNADPQPTHWMPLPSGPRRLKAPENRPITTQPNMNESAQD